MLNLEESINNRTISENSIIIAKNSLKISLISVFIAILLPMIFDKIYETNELKNLQNINTKIEKIISLGNTIKIDNKELMGKIKKLEEKNNTITIDSKNKQKMINKLKIRTHKLESKIKKNK